ncbi:MAG: UMP kinase [Candidatus Staskawiczbacteria bacterium]|nr:UMP kinase [Candidatus Staskawiczbacteria bacterium]
MNKETIIISLGGSLVVPDNIDLGFLKSFKHTLQKYIGNGPSTGSGFKFFIIVGGGKVARNYQNALLEFGGQSKDRDWIGINITRLNAEVIKQMFVGNAYPKVITDPNIKVKTNKDVIVGAGWKPGWSTDYDAVLIAKNHNVKTIINLSNIDYVYDKDPNQFPDAKALKEIDWKSFERIVGDKWNPGLSMPFDPRASKLASKLKLKVVIINGKNLDRLEDCLNNKPFVGTIIQ